MSLMRDEIHQQPQVLGRFLAEERAPVGRIIADIQKRDVRFLVLAARGSSDNAARYGKYLFGSLLGLPVALAAPSLYTLYGTPPQLKDALVIGISQSGQSEDIVSVVADARRQGAPTLAITNFPEAPLGRQADYVVGLHAGLEQAVAATKTYTAQLAALALLAAAWQGNEDRLKELTRAPDWLHRTLELEPMVEEAARRYVEAGHCVVAGRGFNYGTAFEIALKLKETCNLPAEPFSPADFLHGPIALVSPGLPVIVIGHSGAAFRSMLEFSSDLRSRGASLLMISDLQEALGLADVPLRLPASAPEWCSPIVTVVPGQLLAWHLALARGHDPDQPRGLQKVTLTR